jgi:Rrf2 family protein
MLFTQTAEYAVRAVLCLSLSPGRPLTTQQVAAQTRVPAGYLAKILQTLRRAGLVRSTRGTKGGFVLARDPQSLTLYDIVQVVDPIAPFDASPAGDGHVDRAVRRMHQTINRMTTMVQDELQDAQVRDLLKKDGAPRAITAGKR